MSADVYTYRPRRQQVAVGPLSLVPTGNVIETDKNYSAAQLTATLTPLILFVDE